MSDQHDYPPPAWGRPRWLRRQETAMWLRKLPPCPHCGSSDCDDVHDQPDSVSDGTPEDVA